MDHITLTWNFPLRLQRHMRQKSYMLVTDVRHHNTAAVSSVPEVP